MLTFTNPFRRKQKEKERTKKFTVEKDVADGKVDVELDEDDEVANKVKKPRNVDEERGYNEYDEIDDGVENNMKKHREVEEEREYNECDNIHIV